MSEGRYCINLKYRQKSVTNGELIDNPDEGAVGKLCLLHPETEDNGDHVITFVVGAGFLYSAPLDGVRAATPEERATVAKGYFSQPWADPSSGHHAVREPAGSVQPGLLPLDLDENQERESGFRPGLRQRPPGLRLPLCRAPGPCRQRDSTLIL